MPSLPSSPRAEPSCSAAADAANSAPTLPSPQQPYRSVDSPPPTIRPDSSSGRGSKTLSSTAMPQPNSTSTLATSSPRIAMISGHTDLSQDLFDKHYIPQLTTALESGATFILGDAKGVDEMALSWLLTHAKPDGVTVYCSRPYNVPKLEALGLRVVFDPVEHDPASRAGGKGRNKGREAGNPNASRQRHLDRDARMTAASGFDILYVRTDEEARAFYGERWRKRVSATEMNRDRRVVKRGDASAP